MRRDDTLWKAILENVFDDFLRFLFKDADKLLAMDKGFQFLDKELEELFLAEESEAPKFVDKLAKVFTKSGKEEWILIHIEVQGYDDKDFAKRMFTYFYRILDKYRKQITAVAIFTDDNKKFHPTSYEYEFLGTKNSFHFNTYKIIEQDEKLLEQNENPFAVVVLTVLLALKKKTLDDDLLNLKMQIFRNLYRRNVGEKKMRGLQTFLNLYVRFAKPETIAKFEEEIKLFTNNNATMGIEEFVLDRAKKEGIAEGIAKGEARGLAKGLAKGEAKITEAIKNLITKMGLTDTQISEILEVPVVFVEKIRQGLNC